MRRSNLLGIALVVGVVGCHQNSIVNNGDDLGGDDLSGMVPEDLAGEDLAVNVGDLAIGCGFVGDPCSGSNPCCSALQCDPVTNVCVMGMCKATGATCTSPAECCTMTCTATKCGTSCTPDTAGCGGDGECCSGTCASSVCKPLNTMCRTSGNPCSGSDGGIDGGPANCCSGFCDNGICSREASYCTQEGDVCYSNADCCTGLCNIAAGAVAGVCEPLKTMVSCVIDGIRCNGCGDCCSRLCAPFGTSGIAICQPASGCHVYGDLCHKNSDCCGGEAADAGLPGAGLVVCQLIPGAGGLGFCDHPKSSNGDTNTCNPEGNVCHYKDNNYACSGSSSRNNCCACVAGKECCQLDTLGIPRCNAINPADGGTCVPVGGNCTFSGECCGGTPCVPDSTGQLKCGSMCVPEGGTCTTTADCCSGVTCIVPAGSLQGTCTNLNPPPPTDLAGVTDLANNICSEIGQSCEVNPCCEGLICFGSNGPCGTTGAGCLCTQVVK